MTLLDELPVAVAAVEARIATSVVTIGRDRRGAGIVVADGRIVTNAHHLRDRTTQVTFADGRAVQAEVVAADVEGDLAVLAVDTSGATPIEWSEATPTAGTVVFAAALASHGLRVTFGGVSGVRAEFRGPRGRRIGGSLENTAPLARGSSGGPLLDAVGALVGINTHRLGDGFYLALPADADVHRRVDELAAGRHPRRRRLGVAVVPTPVARRLRRAVGLPERDGLLVRGVEDGSPAAAAGVRDGDLIVIAGGVPVSEADDLWAVLDGLAPEGSVSVELGLVRGAEELAVTVAFEDPAPG
jgi:serine protease Do